MSSDARTLDQAIAAYVGFGTSKTPTANSDAVRAIDLPEAAEALRQVEQSVRLSDTITFEEVAPFDADLRQRLYTRLRELFPGLGPTGIEALGWRWGYIQFR